MLKLYHKTWFIGCNGLLHLTEWFNANSLTSKFSTVYTFMSSHITANLTYSVNSTLTTTNTGITNTDPLGNFIVHTNN